MTIKNKASYFYSSIILAILLVINVIIIHKIDRNNSELLRRNNKLEAELLYFKKQFDINNHFAGKKILKKELMFGYIESNDEELSSDALILIIPENTCKTCLDEEIRMLNELKPHFRNDFELLFIKQTNSKNKLYRLIKYYNLNDSLVYGYKNNNESDFFNLNNNKPFYIYTNRDFNIIRLYFTSSTYPGRITIFKSLLKIN